MKPRCPEALYGQHGEANTSGNCPYCGYHLGKERMGRGSRSLTDEELDRTSWARREPVSYDQDPLEIEPVFEDHYYADDA